MGSSPTFSTLAGQRLLVVGGSSGIGLATARCAASHGGRVTIAGRDAERLAAATSLVGDGATGAALDMTDADQVAVFFAANEPFDHIIVTAAAIRSGPVRELPIETAYATFASKFWGSYLIAKFARIDEEGSLTLISGAAARRPRAGRGPVAAASAAIEALARVLAAELAPIRVNCISPGLVDTPMLRAARQGRNQAAGSAETRVGRPEEVAFQILACAVNGYLTGAVIDIDGGLALV